MTLPRRFQGKGGLSIWYYLTLCRLCSQMEIDCGQTLVARVTRHSYNEMALNVGTQVYVTFKSLALHLSDEAESGTPTWVHGE